jgi:hypothetical protein
VAEAEAIDGGEARLARIGWALVLVVAGGLSLAAAGTLFSKRSSFDLALAEEAREDREPNRKLLNILVAIEDAEGRVGEGTLGWHEILQSFESLGLPDPPPRTDLRSKLFRLLSEGRLTRTNAEWYRLSEKGRASLALARRKGKLDG